MRKRFLGVTSTILLLGLASFFNDVSSEIIKAVLPMFIMSLGGTSIAIGLIGGIKDGFDSILRLLFGYTSDKIGKRKIFITSGYFTSAIAKTLLTLSVTWYHVLAFVGLDRLGKGIREAPRDAVIAESMPKRRGFAFGFHKALDNFGAVIGAITAFLLFWFLGFSFKTIVLIAGGIAFLAFIPLIFVKEKKRKPLSGGLIFSIKNFSKELKLFLLVSAVFALANFSYMFLILKVSGLGSGRWAFGLPIALYVLYALFYSGGLIPFGKLSDKVGKKLVITIGYSLFAITCLGFALANSLGWHILLFVLYGLFSAMVKGNQLALVSDLSSNMKGTALGTFQMIIGLIAVVASLLAGLLWIISPSVTFFVGGGLGVCSIVLMVIFWGKINH